MGVNSRRGSNINVGMNYQGVVTGVQQIEGYMGQLTRSVNRIGAAFSAIFAVDMLRGIGSSVVGFAELGGEIDGVTAAFNKLTSEGDLQKLRDATRGMVSDLELMKQGNFARSVGIEMQDLAKVMAYVQKYSAATGKSMAEMMNDATLEMIRQTGLRLDNIGLNVQNVNAKAKEMGFIPAMLSEIDEKSKTLSSSTLTMSERIQQMRVRFENLKNLLAGAFVKTLMTVGTLFSHVADIFVGTFKILSNAAQNAFGSLFKYLYEMGVTMSTMFGPAGALGRTLVQTFAGFADHQNKILTDLPKLRTWGQVWEDVSMIWTKGVPSANEQPTETPLTPVVNGLKADNKKIRVEINKSIDLLKGFSTEIPQTFQTIGEEFKAADPIGYIKEPLIQITKDISGLTEEVNRAIEQFVMTSMFNVLERIGEGLFGAARDVEDWGNKMIASFGGFLSDMGKMIVAYGFAMDAFKKAFTRPEVAIAAGVALIVLGSGIKAMHENKMNGGAGVSSSVPVSSDLGGYNFTGRVDGYDLVLVTDRNQRLMNRRG